MLQGDQSRGLKAGGVIYTRDKIQNKKKKKVQAFSEQCKMTTGLEQKNQKKRNCRVARAKKRGKTQQGGFYRA